MAGSLQDITDGAGHLNWQIAGPELKTRSIKETDGTSHACAICQMSKNPSATIPHLQRSPCERKTSSASLQLDKSESLPQPPVRIIRAAALTKVAISVWIQKYFVQLKKHVEHSCSTSWTAQCPLSQQPNAPSGTSGTQLHFPWRWLRRTAWLVKVTVLMQTVIMKACQESLSILSLQSQGKTFKKPHSFPEKAQERCHML